MPDARPRLDQLNLVASDIEATLAFYRTLGLDLPDEPWRDEHGRAHHVEVRTPDGAGIDIDSEALARSYNAGFEAGDAQRAVIGFSLVSREAVDALYARLTEAGAPGLQPPYDAFWGARYAIVADPDGRPVGLMSPADPARRSAPPAL